ncbi:MAG: OST-HTH/LOTUS domain-containing protein [Opitutaceae bacterium]
MAFSATVYRILVASPGDVGEERDIIPEVINEWNAVSSFATKIILMPLKWESHSSPLLGGRPQEIINEQIVKDADLLVGVFWTRMGTHTGKAVSGTAEEIQQFVDAEKPVMLYFSQSPIDPDKIEIDQFTALKKFKDKMRLKGLTETYSGTIDFRQRFTRQLAINLNNLIDSLAEKEKKKGKQPSRKATTLKKEAVKSLTSVSEEEANSYLLQAIEATSRDDGWADLTAFSIYLNTYTPVNYKDFGFKKLKPFLDSTKLFKFKQITPTHQEIALKLSEEKSANQPG